MKAPGIIAHIRAFIALPFTVTVLIPLLILNFSPNLNIGLINWIPPDFRMLLAVFLFCSGSLLFGWTNYLFYHLGKGTLAPWNPTQNLVLSGPYQYTRNPMITGVFFILLSETLYFNNEWLLFWSGLFFLINHLFFILKEEPDTLKRLGSIYLDYKANVPRWFPRFKPWKTDESNAYDN